MQPSIRLEPLKWLVQLRLIMTGRFRKILDSVYLNFHLVVDDMPHRIEDEINPGPTSDLGDRDEIAVASDKDHLIDYSGAGQRSDIEAYPHIYALLLSTR